MQELWAGNNIATLAFLKSELEAAGIRFVMKNENVNLFTTETGYSLPEIWVVDETQMTEAMMILKDVMGRNKNKAETEEEEEEERRLGKGWLYAFLLLFGILAAVSIWGVIHGR